MSRSNSFFAAVLVVFALLCGALAQRCQPCDSPECSGQCIPCVGDLPCDEDFHRIAVVPSCSLIIPMDNGYYFNDTNERGPEYPAGGAIEAGLFNEKVYGLLVRLLWANVPLRWMIRSGKVKTHDNPNPAAGYDCGSGMGGMGVFTCSAEWTDPIDFVKNVSQRLPNNNTGDGGFLRSFRGGAFIVPVRFTDTALAVIDEYNSQLQDGSLWLGPNFGGDGDTSMGVCLSQHGEVQWFNETDEYAAGLTGTIPVYVLNEDQPDFAAVQGICPECAAQGIHDFKFPFHTALNVKPYVAVFDSAGSGSAGIQHKYMQDAGMIRDNWCDGGNTRPLPADEICSYCINGTHYRGMSKNDAANFGTGVCLTLVTEPHFHYGDQGLNASDPVQNFMDAIRGFMNSGGNSLIECGGIQTYEQCDILPPGDGDPATDCAPYFTTEDGGMFSTGGIDKAASSECGGSTNESFVMMHSDLPIVQWTGPWICQTGSVNRWTFYQGSVNSSLHDSLTRKSVGVLQSTKDDWPGLGYPGSEYVFTLGTGKLNRTDPRGGTFTYLGGHKYVGQVGASNKPGARIYLNAVLMPSQRAGACDLDVPDTCIPSGEETTCFDNERRRQAVEPPNVFGLPCNCQETYDACGVCGGGAVSQGSCVQGGCCTDYACFDNTWGVECSDIGGRFLGGGVTCPSGGGSCNGGCCTGSSCVMYDDKADCPGFWKGYGTDCSGGSPCEAGCCTGLTCNLEQQENCDNSTSLWLDYGNDCSGVEPCGGACCDDGACTVEALGDCSLPDKWFYGLNTECASSDCDGACCSTGSTECTSTGIEDQTDCQSFILGAACDVDTCSAGDGGGDGGDGDGDGDGGSGQGICCSGGTCVTDVDAQTCLILGTFFPDAACGICNYGACCDTDDQTCSTGLVGNCDGVFRGEGSTCFECADLYGDDGEPSPENVEACCYGNTCRDVFVGMCQQGSSGGVGTNCASHTCSAEDSHASPLQLSPFV